MALIYGEETYQVLGACFEVYKELGCGFLEAVYHECLFLEFRLCQIPFTSHPELKLSYKGQPLEKTYYPDFVCFNKIILEIKAMANLCEEHHAQLHNYLRATGLKVGLLANFGHFPKLEYQRYVH